jgi:uncharacterized protein (DUF1778 family)
MARPLKKPELRMDKNLMISVTVAQRDLVNQGAAAAGKDMATWARPILVEAAKREIAKSKGRKSD